MTPEDIARHAGRAVALCTADEFGDTATFRALVDEALSDDPGGTFLLPVGLAVALASWEGRGGGDVRDPGVVKYKVGAEWVQTLPSRVLRLGRLVGRTGSTRREPKGIAHAVDPAGVVACGVDPSTLTVMDQDWEEGLLTRCGPCRAAIAKRDKAGR